MRQARAPSSPCPPPAARARARKRRPSSDGLRKRWPPRAPDGKNLAFRRLSPQNAERDLEKQCLAAASASRCTWQSAGGCRGEGAREGSFRRPRGQPAEGNPRRRSLRRTDGGRVGTALLRREDVRGDPPRVRARSFPAEPARPLGRLQALARRGYVGFFGLKGREGLARRGPSGVLPGANQATLPGRTLRMPRELSPRQAGEAGRGRVV